MENTDSAEWAAFKEKFNQLTASEAGLYRYDRLQASRDLSESDRSHIVYMVYGRDDLRETYISIAIRAGKALGSSDNEDEALSRWLEHVIDEAITEGWRKWWCPIIQSPVIQRYRGVWLVDHSGRADWRPAVSQNTGVLDFLCLASATACERLARKARLTPPPPPNLIRFPFSKYLKPLPPALPPVLYVYQEFPKWKYHATEKPTVVENNAEEQALGPGWYNSPAEVPQAATTSATVQPETCEERAVRRQAILMPLLDKRGWTLSRLITAVGCGKNTIYHYVDGRRKNIKLETRQAIADELKVNLEQIPK